jgi:hypothetical protein
MSFFAKNFTHSFYISLIIKILQIQMTAKILWCQKVRLCIELKNNGLAD